MLAFVHIEKAAGTTLFHMLRRTYGMGHCDVEPWEAKCGQEPQNEECFSATDFRKLRFLYPGLKSICGHSVKPYSDLEAVTDVRYWTFLRDPLTRCASHYQFQIQQMGLSTSFDEWIENDEYRNFMTKKLAGTNSVELAIQALNKKLVFVGLVEKFSESVEISRGILNWAPGARPVSKNLGEDNTIKNQLLENPVTLKKLQDANELDRKLYDYTLYELFPAQKERLMGRSAPPASNCDNRANLLADKRENRYLFKRKHIYHPAIRLYRKWQASGSGKSACHSSGNDQDQATKSDAGK